MTASCVRRFALIGFLACAPLAFAQSGNEEIRKAEDVWASSVSKGNVAEAAKIFSEDLVYTHSTGVKETKAEYLAKLKSGVQVYKSISFVDQKIRTVGNAAVATGSIRMTGTTKGVPFDNTLFFTHVWAKEGGAWKLLAHQTTKKAQ